MTDMYEQYKETVQELPPDPASFADDTIPDDEEEENKPRHRIRHYKKYYVMMQECEAYVNARKRLPLLHSRWIVNRYINEHNFTLQSIPDHNRMVDEMRALQTEVYTLRRRVQELEAGTNGAEQ